MLGKAHIVQSMEDHPLLLGSCSLFLCSAIDLFDYALQFFPESEESANVLELYFHNIQ